MIPNLANTFIGLLLIYAAVLNPPLLAGRFLPLLIVAVAVLSMAIWARRSDNHPWYSNVNITMAVLLAVTAFLIPLNIRVNLAFWGPFWIGIIVAIVALWAALYRPAPAISE